jgi:calcineurin-like phosphoesterase
MLGRLKMSVEECIDAYTALSEKTFQPLNLPNDWKGRIKARFDSNALKVAVEHILTEANLPIRAPLLEGRDRTCNV